MAFAQVNSITLHYRFTPGKGVPIVFLNSLGTDLRIWDEVIARIHDDRPVLCLDKRGHGLSDDAPITMDLLVADVAAIMDRIGLSSALICGVSVGGMIAQGLASNRADLVSGMVLCCTGARIGDDDGWNARIDAIRDEGLSALSDAILERWFSPRFRPQKPAELAGYRNMLIRTGAQGYTGVCAAIRDSDFTGSTATITVPTICLAGADDLATPPELVADLSRLLHDSELRVISACGHLPCIEAPDAVAKAISDMTARPL